GRDRDDAGVEHERVDRLVLRGDRRERAVHALRVGDVDGERARAVELPGERPRPLLVEVEQPYAVVAGEAAGRRRADPAGRAGDHRDRAHCSSIAPTTSPGTTT